MNQCASDYPLRQDQSIKEKPIDGCCPWLVPLVGAEAGVCRGQQRLQVRRELVQLHGEGGEAVVEQVVLRLWVCGAARTGHKRQVLTSSWFFEGRTHSLGFQMHLGVGRVSQKIPSCHRPPKRCMMFPLWSRTVPWTSFLLASEPQ